MRKLLVAMALGAALAYFLDPDNGERRRRACQRRVSKSSSTGGGG